MVPPILAPFPGDLCGNLSSAIFTARAFDTCRPSNDVTLAFRPQDVEHESRPQPINISPLIP